MPSFLTEKTFYLLCGPLAGAAVGASTMAVMDRGAHPSAMEAEIACQKWKEEAKEGTRLCFKEADTNQVLGMESQSEILKENLLSQPLAVSVVNRFKY